MIKKGDIRKHFICLLCILVIFPMLGVVPTPVVLSEEIKEVNKEKSLQEVEAGKEAKDDLVITLEEQDRSSFNVSEIMVHITNSTNDFEELLLVVTGENSEVIINEFDNESQEVKLVDLEEGFYTVLAKIIVSEDEEELISNTLEFEIDLTEPEIELDKPNEDITNSSIITGKTESDLNLSFQMGEEIFELTDAENFDFTYGKDGSFSFDLGDLIEDQDEVELLVLAEDEAGNIGTATLNFTYDISRPFISPNSLSPRPNMTQVPVEGLEIKFQIIDNDLDIDAILAKKAIQLNDNNGEVPGKVTFDKKTNTFIFTPEQGTIKSFQKYHVLINPLLTDRAGNFIHPRNWSFTTAKQKPSFLMMSTGGHDNSSPHGNYLMNTNACATCHNSHSGTGVRLEGPDGELQKKLEKYEMVTTYCMACHDGTAASSMPENMDQHSVSNHNKQLVTKDGVVVNQSCGSCHNVHLETRPENPNLLKDQVVFNHTGIVGTGGLGYTSSLNRLCESCHEMNLQEIYNKPGVKYEVLSSKNWNTSLEDLHDGRTSFGSAEDYELCLRCHNYDYKQKYKNIVDISSLYNDDSSGHYISKDRVQDGSLLDGHMPCADCHETHGSANNVGLLKDQLGHNNTMEFRQTDSWTVEAERRFCTTCHNNETEMYGNTIEFMNIYEHGPFYEKESCSTCHGQGGDFIKAVHSPMRQG